MFVQFILPYDVRNDPFSFEWIMFKACHEMGLSDLALMAPSLLWEHRKARECANEWAMQESVQRRFDFKPPSAARLNAYRKAPLHTNVLQQTEADLVAPGKVWAHTMTTPIPALTRAIGRALDALAEEGSIEAILCWTNCESLRRVAAARRLPILYNELGPLRSPAFVNTAYFDFSGVNGRTQAAARWERFLAGPCDVPVLTRGELLDLLALAPSPEAAKPTHRIGVALQVPDDSNLLAYGNGFTNFEIVATALRWFRKDDVLVRPHPDRCERFERVRVAWDSSANARAFLDRVSALMTINSSVALEALLLGKETYILGNSPMACASWDLVTRTPRLDEGMAVRWLNWFVFAYLIPYDHLFDAEYYRWRLTHPPEDEIYGSNLEHYLSLRV